LYLASMLQRLRPADRWPIAEALLQHVEDAHDDNLPLMIWYALEPLVHEDLNRFIGLTAKTKISLVARHIARRVASIPKSNDSFNLLTQQLITVESDIQSEMLAGMIEGIEGRRAVAMPPEWHQIYAKLQMAQNPSTRERSLQLALIFDDPAALEMLRRVAADKTAEADSRARAIQALISKRSGDVAKLLLELVSDPATRRVAIRGLAEFDHPETASVLLKHYETYDTPTKQDIAQTLAARLPWAVKLLDALEAGRVSRNDITAYTARQLYNLNDKPLLARLKSKWGELRTSPAEKTQKIASYKRNLTAEVLKKADRGAGRALFQKTCASCHRFFDAGGSIGPDITGAQRTNLDYLLQTLVDPSATVAKDYQMQVVETTGGRVITGLIVSETKTALTIQTVNEKVIVPIDEIEERKISDLSIMPEGMLQNLTSEQIRNLITYLMGPEQVPLPVEKAASNQ
jgi:putative heme-binding domain-containing protein